MLELHFVGDASKPFWERPDEEGWYVKQDGEQVAGPFICVRDAQIKARRLRRSTSERIACITLAGNRLEPY